MRLAIATHFPKDPNVPHGGVEAVSVHLVKALASFRDLDVHVVTLDNSLREPKVFAWQGASIHRLPGPDGSALINAIGKGRRQVSQYLMILAPDIIHAHDTYGLAVKGLLIPRVFTIHGFIYADTLLSKTRWSWARSKIWHWLETSGWAEQPHIISISPYVRERLSGIAKGVIHDIDNPISQSFFQIERKERKGVIFSAAVISQRKNTLTLIKAFAKLIKEGCKAELRLAGPVVEPGYGRLVQESISRWGLDDKVAMLGQIDTGQVHEELAKASIFALVSLEENSPMGIEEAMAAGIPVVTSNRCGMPYMVRHGESGYLVNPTDTFDIVRCLKKIIENDVMRDEMGKYARETALARFHPEVVARRTRDVYLQVLGENGTVCNKPERRV